MKSIRLSAALLLVFGLPIGAMAQQTPLPGKQGAMPTVRGTQAGQSEGGGQTEGAGQAGPKGGGALMFKEKEGGGKKSSALAYKEGGDKGGGKKNSALAFKDGGDKGGGKKGLALGAQTQGAALNRNGMERNAINKDMGASRGMEQAQQLKGMQR
ncbi:hypothetical protein HZ992_00635 [Rhizobacter sp. AJA081-3]|jgi:hypothetical protein|uniref:hypothetical protein n=1 Tax=Rhizobacter sp. AJA081-3 TaxID=2753607 RepID=UPI001ADF21FF|nr:hypothetical protein [Rhizobacter sp. AJA081-3]QTN23548.1 hypothetical protein HZ992_00635 [Rhizobacter sp. AJA081-3]